MEKSDPCEEPLNQKADSRPAIRECREQSLQAKSLREATALAMAWEALRGETGIIPLGDLAKYPTTECIRSHNFPQCRGLMFADAKVSIDAFVQWARLIFCEQIKNSLFPERARGL